MQHSIHDIDEVIGKYLAGEASPEEILFVERWEKEDESNRKYVDQFKIIFHKASAVKVWQEFDTDAAWRKVKSKLHKRDDTVRPLYPFKSNFSALKIAASIILVLGIGFFAYQMNTSKLIAPVEVVANRKTLGDTLPDGSGVFLNKQTKLAYAYDKKKKTHVVKLKGEAFFSINHEDNKKFIVDAEGVFVRDIGTSFNVTAYPESNTVEVIVVEGEVEFFTEKDSGIHLKAGGKGIYDKTTKTFTIDQPESNVLAYKTKFFSFSDSDLATVVASLNNVYDRKIVIGDSLRKCHLTVSFNDEDIEEVAQVIAETLHLTVRKTANEIILEGEGCETH